VKVSSTWLKSTSADFSAGMGRTGCAHLKHYSVNYQEWGEGPPLLLIPGLAGGYGLLGPLARLLSTHFRVISYQLRGEDDCFALRQQFDLADLANDLGEFLNWYGLESPIVMGVSFGGVLALEFAARSPHRLERLIVQGAGARYENGFVPRIARAVLTRFPLPSDNPFINQFFNLLFGGKQKPGPLVEFVTRQCWQTDQSMMAYRLRMLEQYDVTNRLGRIRVPTLVLNGDRDILVSEASLNELGAGLPDATICTLPGCGHLAFVTHPQRVAAEVRRFTQIT
jgi:pimeloyl-ACP methyl ester carboxylesterase